LYRVSICGHEAEKSTSEIFDVKESFYFHTSHTMVTFINGQYKPTQAMQKQLND